MTGAMHLNKVRKRWSEGLPAISGWMTSSCPLIGEALAASGLDCVIIDMQHSATSLADAIGLAAVIELRGAEPFVRVPSLDPALIGKLIDLGVTGIIVPMVETRRMAEALVSAVRYPPLGTRSVGPRRPRWRFGEEYFEKAAMSIVTLAMIETMKGLGALEEIATTEGLDGVFVGPADLEVALGGRGPGEDCADDNLEEAIAAIRARTWSLGRRAGIFGGTAKIASQRLAQGFDLVSTTPDLAAVAATAANELSLLRRPALRES